MFLRFSAAKNPKNTIPARNWRDPDAPAAIVIMTHTVTITITITITMTIITITITVTITPPPPTRHCRRGGSRVFEVFGSYKP